MSEEMDFGGDVNEHAGANQNCRDRAKRCPCVHFGVLSFGEAHGYGIHAVAEAGWFRAVVEDVA